MAGWKLTPDPDRFYGLSRFCQSVGFLIHYFAFMLKRPSLLSFTLLLEPVQPRSTVPGFGFAPNTSALSKAYAGVWVGRVLEEAEVSVAKCEI